MSKTFIEKNDKNWMKNEYFSYRVKENERNYFLFISFVSTTSRFFSVLEAIVRPRFFVDYNMWVMCFLKFMARFCLAVENVLRAEHSLSLLFWLRYSFNSINCFFCIFVRDFIRSLGSSYFYFADLCTFYGTLDVGEFLLPFFFII